LDLKAKLEEVSQDVINRVRVFGVFQNRTITAGSESFPYKTTESLEEEENESMDCTLPETGNHLLVWALISMPPISLTAKRI